MSWRDLEKKRIETVRPIDQSEVVLELEGGELVKIRATPSSRSPESGATLEMEMQKAKQPGPHDN